MQNARPRFRALAVAAIVAVGLVLLPEVPRSVTATVVQIADRNNQGIKAT